MKGQVSAYVYTSRINVEDPNYEGLNRIADTLFSPDIACFHILTVFQHGAEQLPCKAIELFE